MAGPKPNPKHRGFTQDELDRMNAPLPWWQYILAVPIVLGIGVGGLYLVGSFVETLIPGCDPSVTRCEPVFSDDAPEYGLWPWHRRH
jgi:uncharacterized RDD family membrane protein YckC